jgi:hypothetical protein
MKYLAPILAVLIAASIANAENYTGRWVGRERLTLSTCNENLETPITLYWGFQQRGKTVTVIGKTFVTDGVITKTGFKFHRVYPSPVDSTCTKDERQTFVRIAPGSLRSLYKQYFSCTDGYYCVDAYSGTFTRKSK